MSEKEISSIIMAAKEFGCLLGLPAGVKVHRVDTSISDAGHDVEIVFHADTNVITDAEFQVWQNSMYEKLKGCKDA